MANHHRARPPWHYAGAIAGTYLLVSVVWIVGSGRVAKMLATSVEALARIEEFKGLFFVASSALGLFLLSLDLFRRLDRFYVRATESREALVAADRRALAGTLAAAVAHDANNILTVLVGLNELLLADSKLQERSRDHAEEMMRAIDRLTDMIQRMRRAGGQGVGRGTRTVPLVAVVRDAVALLHAHARVRRVQVRVVEEGAVTLACDPPAIQNAVTNLVLNAAEAIDGTGNIEVRIRTEGDFAIVEVHDDGPGVPEDQRERILEGFFTTKAEGTGLGLLSVQAAAEGHGGRVEVSRSPLGGACFRMTLAKIP